MISISAHDKEAQRIAWQAYDLLAEQQCLRTTTSDIQVEAKDGRLILNGRVRTNLMRNLAQRIAQVAANGWQLENNLWSDEALSVAAAAQLAQDARTVNAGVRCHVFLGVAHLQGLVNGQEQQQAVLDIVSQVPGITGVRDSLTLAKTTLTQR